MSRCTILQPHPLLFVLTNGHSSPNALVFVHLPLSAVHPNPALFKEVSDELTIPYCSINSGAGHDAMVFSDFTACGMVFIPSKDWLSHCPEEWSDAGHLADGTDILLETAKRLTEAQPI